MTAQKFQTLVDTHYDKIFGFAMKLTRNRENAKDLYQETMVKAYANIHRYEEGTYFKSWVTTIMRNSFINDYRKWKTRNQVEAHVEDEEVLINTTPINSSAESNIFLQELNQIIDKLPEIHRIPFEMHCQGFQYDEISEKIDMPLGTVKSRIFFARKKIKAQYQLLFGEYRSAA